LKSNVLFYSIIFFASYFYWKKRETCKDRRILYLDAVVHLLDLFDVSGTQAYALANCDARLEWRDRVKAIRGERGAAVVHERSVVVAQVKGHHLGIRVLVKVVLVGRGDVLKIDSNIIISVRSRLLVPRAKSVQQFVLNDAKGDASATGSVLQRNGLTANRVHSSANK